MQKIAPNKLLLKKIFTKLVQDQVRVTATKKFYTFSVILSNKFYIISSASEQRQLSLYFGAVPNSVLCVM